MKSIKLTLALGLLATIGRAQPYTAETTYGHGNALLSSGTHVNAVPGFVMAGYLPTTATGSSNFIIDKVYWDGNFVGASSFSREFLLFNSGPNCSGSTSQALNCYGASVIESNGGGTISYVAAAAFDAGVVFAALSTPGTIVASSFHTFPNGAIPDSKPLITPAASGGYYICGSYRLNTINYIYVIRVAVGGTSIWSTVYDFGAANSIFTPRGIVEDNYPGTDELAIVGIVGTSTTDGFFMTIDESTGSVTILKAFASGLPVNETLNSIALSNAGSLGYIVGGSTDVNTTNGRAWMMNLDISANINWSTRIRPSTNASAGVVVGVQERFNTYGTYEYYGLTVSSGATGGMMVLKLDQAGSPFSQPGNIYSEFVYNQGGTGSVAVPVSISLLNGGSTNMNSGIHVFGNNNAGSPSRFFLTQACFNGATGNCSTPSQQILTTITSFFQGPQATYPFNVNNNAGPNPCFNYILSSNTIGYSVNQPCSATILPTLPYMGDNSRTMAPTGISEATNNSASLSVYPNPVSGVAQVSYVNEEGGDIRIQLTNVLGQQIKMLDSGYKPAGSNTLDLDMTSLNLETGVYILSITMNGKTSQQKIVFNKN